jgi:hypothetical protein
MCEKMQNLIGRKSRVRTDIVEWKCFTLGLRSDAPPYETRNIFIVIVIIL